MLDELDVVLDSDDPFTVAIRGHQALEAILDLAIIEALEGDNSLELSRLSFALKVNLASALGVVRRDSRGLILRLNRIRNAFAHERGVSFGAGDAAELLSLLPPDLHEGVIEQRRERYASEPLNALKSALNIAVALTKMEIERLRDTKALCPDRARSG